MGLALFGAVNIGFWRHIPKPLFKWRVYHALPFCHLQIRAVRGSYSHLGKRAQTVPLQPKTRADTFESAVLKNTFLQVQLAKFPGCDLRAKSKPTPSADN